MALQGHPGERLLELALLFHKPGGPSVFKNSLTRMVTQGPPPTTKRRPVCTLPSVLALPPWKWLCKMMIMVVRRARNT